MVTTPNLTKVLTLEEPVNLLENNIKLEKNIQPWNCYISSYRKPYLYKTPSCVRTGL
jgi:hypothetical protein